MKIVICGSILFSKEMTEIAEKLEAAGHEAELPYMTQKINKGEVSFNHFKAVKETDGDNKFRNEAEEDLIIRYFDKIKKADCVLAVNVEKKGQPNYIGANTFIELAFGHVLKKKLYLLNPKPDFSYISDELIAMQPTILNGDLSKIE